MQISVLILLSPFLHLQVRFKEPLLQNFCQKITFWTKQIKHTPSRLLLNFLFIITPPSTSLNLSLSFTFPKNLLCFILPTRSTCSANFNLLDLNTDVYLYGTDTSQRPIQPVNNFQSLSRADAKRYESDDKKWNKITRNISKLCSSQVFTYFFNTRFKAEIYYILLNVSSCLNINSFCRSASQRDTTRQTIFFPHLP